VHWVFHSLAFIAALLGFLAAWKSHTLKQPPIPNLYSPHSYIGLAALLLLVGQVRAQQCSCCRKYTHTIAEERR
jgi:cytochrome b561